MHQMTLISPKILKVNVQQEHFVANEKNRTKLNMNDIETTAAEGDADTVIVHSTI